VAKDETSDGNQGTEVLHFARDLFAIDGGRGSRLLQFCPSKVKDRGGYPWDEMLPTKRKKFEAVVT